MFTVQSKEIQDVHTNHKKGLEGLYFETCSKCKNIVLIRTAAKCIGEIKALKELTGLFFVLFDTDYMVLDTVTNGENTEFRKWIPRKGTPFAANCDINAFRKDDITRLETPVCFNKQTLGYLSLFISDNYIVGGLRAFVECVSNNISNELFKLNLLGSLKQYTNRGRQTIKLSCRELEVIECILKGYPNSRIASELYISEATVKTYLKRIFSKYGTANRTDTALFALGRKLIDKITGKDISIEDIKQYKKI